MKPQPATHAGVTVNRHETGKECVESATRRASNTTIVIGVDRIGGTLAIDIDTQGEVHPLDTDLAKDLRMIAEAIETRAEK
ncbi:hypothetical protein [Glutamicibacter nicotianae]|uniref:hypothetical protein n=1 Tax=Glutamicibacter nicotianae TaxID=37929 RepID=UPI00167FBE29|nr:hypothetical protein [Glutamicibacter nicotianae]